jgi:NifU-like protein involved in Fe-S cluster formation
MNAANTADDDALLRVYNQELIALSAQADKPRRLVKPDASAKAISPICGSEVTIELTVQNDKVTGFGYEVEACALTKSAVAVMAKAIVGKTRPEIAQAGLELQSMLSGGAAPRGDWAGLKILEPVVDYKARHNAIMLPFEAVDAALAKIKELM